MTNDGSLHTRIIEAIEAAKRAHETGESRYEAMELLVQESRAARAALFAIEGADANALRRTWEPALNALTTAYYVLASSGSNTSSA